MAEGRLCKHCGERPARKHSFSCGPCRYGRVQRGKAPAPKPPPVVRLRVLPLPEERPRYRRDCENVERPCPWIGCKFHVLSDEVLKLIDEEWDKKGAGIRYDPDLSAYDALIDKPDTVPRTCVLDAADDAGEHTLEESGEVFGVTRERVRQVETQALERAKLGREGRKLKMFTEED